ncbi:hypothetical protein B0H14DRAFT_2615639 [Mycena olivaceomarginata]|nr:hypothetical protein B0H14DRAFT_2615639 [Mycena olivaceomarginata]
MAPGILQYNNPVPRLLDPSIPEMTLQELDFTTKAVWYLDREHWLGWIPTGEPPATPYETEPALNLLEICFRRAWVEKATYLGDRLHAISRVLAENSKFYCRGPPLNLVGDFPGSIEIRAIFLSEGEAQEAATKLKDTKLTAGDQCYLQQLCLGDRPKTGAVFSLTRNQHKINFPHWANNEVPFHYVWTEEELRNKAAAGLHRRSSRSLSPPKREGKGKRRQARSLSSAHAPDPSDENSWFHEDYLSAVSGYGTEAGGEDEEMEGEIFTANQDDTPFNTSIDAIATWIPKYLTSKEALADLAAWAPSVIEYDPEEACVRPALLER